MFWRSELSMELSSKDARYAPHQHDPMSHEVNSIEQLPLFLAERASAMILHSLWICSSSEETFSPGLPPLLPPCLIGSTIIVLSVYCYCYCYCLGLPFAKLIDVRCWRLEPDDRWLLCVCGVGFDSAAFDGAYNSIFEAVQADTLKKGGGWNYPSMQTMRLSNHKRMSKCRHLRNRKIMMNCDWMRLDCLHNYGINYIERVFSSLFEEEEWCGDVLGGGVYRAT